MAQIFQPTNIIPDLRGAFGHGVVDMDYSTGELSIPVTWQVNGNTPMEAFKISFYKNDGSGDLLYETAKLTTNCPFYGYDNSGNVQLFSYKVSKQTLIQNGVINMSEYQMKITQYWGAGATESVEQASPSVFLTRAKPSVSVTTGGHTLDTYTITSRSLDALATHSNEEYSGGLSWISWELSYPGGATIKETGKLYGQVEPTFQYDALLPGKYNLIFTAETEYGMSIVVPSQFWVSYDSSPSGMIVDASKACGGESAVQIQWPLILQIPLQSSTGLYSKDAKNVALSSTATMTWDEVNGDPMAFPPGWSILYKGIVAQYCRSIFNIELSDGSHLRLSCDPQPDYFGSLDLIWTSSDNNQEIVFANIVDFGGGELFFCVTPTMIYYYFSGGTAEQLILPDDALFPDNTLYPRSDVFAPATLMSQVPEDFSYTGKYINSVEVSGPQTVEYLKIVDHEVTAKEIYESYAGTQSIVFDVETEFLFSVLGEDYDAGNYFYDITDIESVSLYRISDADSTPKFVGNFGLTQNSVLDYGAGSQQGPFTYYLYIVGETTLSSTPSVSNVVDPCFWNWDLLSCTKNADGSYSVKKSYLFGKNLTSGSISNNNRPNVLNNFTRYPTVQLATQNFQSGSLQSLIGTIDYAGGQNAYSDTIELRDEIFSLSTTTNTLFLKNRKGDVLQVRIAGEISMETMDNTREQALSVTLPWAEVGSAKGTAIYQIIGN